MRKEKNRDNLYHTVHLKHNDNDYKLLLCLSHYIYRRRKMSEKFGKGSTAINKNDL